MARAGAFEAIKLSLGMFRRYFWSSVAFVVVSAVIGQASTMSSFDSRGTPRDSCSECLFTPWSHAVSAGELLVFQQSQSAISSATNSAGSAPSR